MDNIEWQLAGSKSEVNLSLKSLGQKMLTQMTTVANTMKGIQSEMKVQHTALMDTLNGALKELTSVLAGVQTWQSVSPGWAPLTSQLAHALLVIQIFVEESMGLHDKQIEKPGNNYN